MKDRRFEAFHLCGLAVVRLALGAPEDARRTWREGASLLRALRDARALERMATAMRDACRVAGVDPFDLP